MNSSNVMEKFRLTEKYSLSTNAEKFLLTKNGKKDDTVSSILKLVFLY